MTAIHCEICAGESSAWITVDDFEHYRCSRCRHVFVWPRPTQTRIEHVYSRTDYYEDAELHRMRILRQGHERLDRLEKIARNAAKPRRLLEIGCADGLFLKAAKDRGWQVFGVERSHSLAERARLACGDVVFEGLLEDYDNLDTFAFVCAWEVIEHVISPRDFLLSLTHRLEPDGILALSTPLIDGIVAKLMGRRFPMIMPPEHLSLFSRESLTRLANGHDLDLIYFSSFSHLGARSLASGFARIVLRTELAALPGLARASLVGAASIAAWVPQLVDYLGHGTEMEVFFRHRPKSQNGSLRRVA